jgi:hypothetical protein
MCSEVTTSQLVFNIHKVYTDHIVYLNTGNVWDQSISECIENFKKKKNSLQQTYNHMFYWSIHPWDRD